MTIDQIKPYDKNQKKHPDKQLKQIARSIKEFGWQQPIVVDKNGIIIVGHGRYFAYIKYKVEMGLPEPRIEVADKLNEEQVKAYRLADNKLNESDWDMEFVVEELRELNLKGFDIDLTGFDRDLLIELDKNDDDVPDLPTIARTKLGDIYDLGRHRIMCGDSTDPEQVKKMLKNFNADMVFTDPPYNVDYSGTGKNTSEKIMNDKMSDENFDEFLLNAFSCIKQNIKPGAGCYIFHSHKTMTTFEAMLKKNDFTIDTQLIWNKPSAGLGMNDYKTKHEPFFYCYLKKDKKNFYGDRTGTTVWKIPNDVRDQIKWMTRFAEKEEDGKTTIWTFSRAKVNEYVHPTQKPVELIVKAIHNSSKQGDIVLDTFLGSGSTLIACEKSNRDCYGMELDPKYIDVIVERYLNYTDNKTIILNGKEITWN